MAYIESWHRHPGRFWPVLGGPNEPWWIGHSFCLSLPYFIWLKVQEPFLKGVWRTGVFDLCEGETINDNWRRIWRQVIGRE